MAGHRNPAPTKIEKNKRQNDKKGSGVDYLSYQDRDAILHTVKWSLFATPNTVGNDINTVHP